MVSLASRSDTMASDTMAGWEAVNAALAAARAEVLAAAPDSAIAAEGETYLMRVLTACLNDAFLSHLFTESGLTRVLPVRGGPNPDYKMAVATLDQTRRYRLDGWLNNSERVGVGIYSFGPGGSANISSYVAIDRDSVESGFSVDIATDAQGPRALAIRPDARVLMIRILHRDPCGAPARLVLSGGPPFSDLTQAQGNADAALRHVAQTLLRSIRSFLEWSAVTSAAVNRFHAETPSLAQTVQGDPDTTYFLGSFNLKHGEWLEVTMPAGIPGYWSLHAYNYWCESLPGAGVGDDSCITEADGTVRIDVGPTAGGDAPNRVDTRGRERGALICRFIGATQVTVPATVVRTAIKPAEKRGRHADGH
jgi:hypothetical protein